MAEARLILTICGSLRAGSTNAAVLRTAAAVAPAGVSVRSYGGMGALPHFDPDRDVEAASSGADSASRAACSALSPS